MSEKSANSNPISLTGPVQGQGGTAGHLPAGYQLRDFRIEQVLGEGGFSVVYVATDLRLEREVAIKEYMPTALATRNPDLSVQVRSSVQHREAFEAGLRSFVNEAKLLAHFEHRALVKVHQFWQERGTAYMVMPRYTGPTLKSWIKQRNPPVDPKWVERFLGLLMDGLETLHRENCLHRDVAPDNILVLNDSLPLLLDFGAARRVIGDLTQALTVILKPGFAPIEQYAESTSMRQGAWTDVYALCAVAHFMITGKAPTPAVSRVLADDLVPLSVVAADRFPPAFLAALDAGLSVRPQQRPQSIAALRALMNGAPTENTVTTPPVSPQPVALPAAPPVQTRAPLNDDDDKTLLIAGRDSLPPTGTNTISTPSKPATFPLDAVEATGGSTDAQSFEPRYPSRSMQELAKVEAQESDPWAWIPFLIGGIAIAAVVAAAWFLVNWFNAQSDLKRAPPPSSAVPVPAPVAAIPSPDKSTAPAAAAATTESPAPVPTPAAASAESTPPVATPAVQTEATEPAGPVQLATAPANTSPAPAPEQAVAPSSNEPQVSAPPVAGTPSSAPTETGAALATPALPAVALDPPIAPKSEAASPAASVQLAVTEAPKQAEPPVPQPEPAATKPAPAASSKPAPTVAKPPAPPPAKPAAIAKPTEPQRKEPPAKPVTIATAETPHTAPPPAAANPPPPLPPLEMEVAPSLVAPTVKTVDAMPPPAPPVQVAAVEPPRPTRATTPSVAAPLKPINRPQPTFPREAVRNAIDKGHVTARLFIAPDGTVTRVDIVAANPTRVFDREVRETAMRWRYEAPGQPRQADVEFLFDRLEGQ